MPAFVGFESRCLDTMLAGCCAHAAAALGCDSAGKAPLHCTLMSAGLPAGGEQLLAQSTFHSQCLREKLISCAWDEIFAAFPVKHRSRL